MPYKLRKAPRKELYWVVNTETSRRYSKEPMPKEKAQSQMRALYANEKQGGSDCGCGGGDECITKTGGSYANILQEIKKTMKNQNVPPEVLEAAAKRTKEAKEKRDAFFKKVNEDHMKVAQDAEKERKMLEGKKKEYIEELRDLGKETMNELMKEKKSGGAKTHKQNVLKALGLKDTGHSLKELAEASGVPKEILQQVYNRGIGAYKTNPQSVRMKGTFKKGDAPMSQKLSKEQWGMARVYSYLDSNPNHDNDLRGGTCETDTPIPADVLKGMGRKGMAFLMSEYINTFPDNTRQGDELLRHIRGWIKSTLKGMDCGCGCKGLKKLDELSGGGCPAGYKMNLIAGKCVQDCKPGEDEDPISAGQACFKDCPQGYRKDGVAQCVKNCPDKYRDDGLKHCKQDCDPGWLTSGDTCIKDCPPGSSTVAEHCWPDCPSGYRVYELSAGYDCIQNCPPGWKDNGFGKCIEKPPQGWEDDGDFHLVKQECPDGFGSSGLSTCYRGPGGLQPVNGGHYEGVWPFGHMNCPPGSGDNGVFGCSAPLWPAETRYKEKRNIGQFNIDLRTRGNYPKPTHKRDVFNNDVYTREKYLKDTEQNYSSGRDTLNTLNTATQKTIDALSTENLNKNFDPEQNGVANAIRNFPNDAAKQAFEVGEKLLNGLNNPTAVINEIRKFGQTMMDTVGNDQWWRDTMSDPKTYILLLSVVVQVATVILTEGVASPLAVAALAAIGPALDMLVDASKGKTIDVTDIVKMGLAMAGAGAGAALAAGVKAGTTAAKVLPYVEQVAMIGDVIVSGVQIGQAFGQIKEVCVFNCPPSGDPPELTPEEKCNAAKAEYKGQLYVIDPATDEAVQPLTVKGINEALPNPEDWDPNLCPKPTCSRKEYKANNGMCPPPPEPGEPLEVTYHRVLTDWKASKGDEAKMAATNKFTAEMPKPECGYLMYSTRQWKCLTRDEKDAEQAAIAKEREDVAYLRIVAAREKGEEPNEDDLDLVRDGARSRILKSFEDGDDAESVDVERADLQLVRDRVEAARNEGEEPDEDDLKLIGEWVDPDDGDGDGDGDDGDGEDGEPADGDGEDGDDAGDGEDGEPADGEPADGDDAPITPEIEPEQWTATQSTAPTPEQLNTGPAVPIEALGGNRYIKKTRKRQMAQMGLVASQRPGANKVRALQNRRIMTQTVKILPAALRPTLLKGGDRPTLPGQEWYYPKAEFSMGAQSSADSSVAAIARKQQSGFAGAGWTYQASF